MLKADVVIGQTYVMMVSGKLQPVRIDSVSKYKGWCGVNINTHRDIHIKSAAKLRRVYVAPATHTTACVEKTMDESPNQSDAV